MHWVTAKGVKRLNRHIMKVNLCITAFSLDNGLKLKCIFLKYGYYCDMCIEVVSAGSNGLQTHNEQMVRSVYACYKLIINFKFKFSQSSTMMLILIFFTYSANHIH